MKLELKHLAPYLPYGLKVLYHGKLKKMNAGQGSSTHWIGITATLQRQCEYCKPILRPLSDIYDTSIISHDLGGKNSDAIREWYDYFESDALNRQTAALCAPYPVIEWLFKYHFDVFGLIKSGLAIDINTILNDSKLP